MAVQPHPCCHVRHCRSPTGITPLIQQNLVESSGVEKNTALAIGALSGAILAGTITHPMDTIKTCMQGDIERRTYTTFSGTAQQLLTEGEGYGRFFRGWSFRCARHTHTGTLTRSRM